MDKMLGAPVCLRVLKQDSPGQALLQRPANPHFSRPRFAKTRQFVFYRVSGRCEQCPSNGRSSSCQLSRKQKNGTARRPSLPRLYDLATFGVTLRPIRLLVSRICPEDGIVDVVLEGVRRSLCQVVLLDPRNQLRLVKRVLVVG